MNVQTKRKDIIYNFFQNKIFVYVRGKMFFWNFDTNKFVQLTTKKGAFNNSFNGESQTKETSL